MNIQKPVVISHLAETESKQFLEYETLLLPLLNGSSNTLRILGTAAPSENPIWMGIDPVINNRIKSVRFVDIENMEAPSLSPNLPITSNETQSAPRRVGHLTILDGGLDN